MASSKDWVSRVKALVEGSNSTTSSLADSAGTVKQTKVDKPPTASPPDSTPKGTTQKLDAKLALICSSATRLRQELSQLIGEDFVEEIIRRELEATSNEAKGDMTSLSNDDEPDKISQVLDLSRKVDEVTRTEPAGKKENKTKNETATGTLPGYKFYTISDSDSDDNGDEEEETGGQSQEEISARRESSEEAEGEGKGVDEDVNHSDFEVESVESPSGSEPTEL